MVSIGVGAPLSGRANALGAEMKHAVEMAVDDWNHERGIGGAPVTMVAVDDEGNAGKAIEAARYLAGKPDVLGVVGHYHCDATLAAALVYEDARMPMITPVTSHPAVTDRGTPCVFRFANRDDVTGRAIAHYLVEVLGKRRAVVVEADTMGGKSLGGEFSAAFMAFGGRLAFYRPVSEDERDFDQLISVLPDDFDVLFYAGAFGGAAILRALRTAGLDQLFAAGDGCWDLAHFVQPAGGAAAAGEGVLVLSTTPEIGSVAGSREFSRRFEQRYGRIGNYAVNSYDTARILLEAIARAARDGVLDRESVCSAVRTTSFQGIAYPHPVQWDDKGDNRATLTALHVVDHGRFREVAEIGRDEHVASRM